MITVADIFRRYGPAYRAKFGERMPATLNCAKTSSTVAERAKRPHGNSRG